ncbi:hypothetical protein GGH96_006324 [Coemansia sp. RSA 1972]|nr:hypothetical protein GGH96_006324 [Coemansia sp. RSA 1972]
MKQILHTCHLEGTTTEEKKIIDFLSPVLSCYPVNYTFEDDSIHLDAKMYPERHVQAFIILNKCLAAANYWCIQALPLQRSWIYWHVPMVTQIPVHHILKDEYAPVTDKWLAKTAKKQAVSNDEPAVSAEQGRFTDEEYWAKVVDLKLRVFKDHPSQQVQAVQQAQSVQQPAYLMVQQAQSAVQQPSYLMVQPLQLSVQPLQSSVQTVQSLVE